MKKFAIALLVLMIAASPALTTAWAHSHENHDSKEVVVSPGVEGTFKLVDGDGKDVTEKSWPGKYKLVFFGFTNCPEICPVTLDKVAKALDKLGADAEKVQPLFITTDPARDTPKVVKEYSAKFHKSITGLTGTEEQVKVAEASYKVYAVKRETEGGDYQIDHSGFIYFMSPDDKMIQIIGGKETADEIADKVQTGLK